jgi:tRNA pseudouridine55 synthase
MRRNRSPTLSGFLNLNKPSGLTSRAVVNCVARPLRGVKVGHAGTLDPLASGVLVVGVGAATRLVEFVQRMPKTYRTVVRLGVRSDTLDADGQIRDVRDPRIPSEAEVRAALMRQVGTIAQKPPEFSAIKVEGRRAYDLTRAGVAIDLKPRLVTISHIGLLDYTWPRLELEIDCGGGTYIRSIARDLDEELGCGGLVEVLVRTRIGAFTLDAAIPPDNLSAESIAELLRPSLEAVVLLPQLRLSADQVADVAQGKALAAGRLAGATVPAGEIALLGPDGALVAVAEGVPESGQVLPRRVLVAS